MMVLKDYRDDYYVLSSKASDVARQLSFAGIALIWIFKFEKGGPLAIPQGLLWPALFFVIALGFDLLQYSLGSLIWGWFARHHENLGKDDEESLEAPSYFNWPLLLFFWGKLLFVVVAYGLVAHYVYTMLFKTP